MGGESCPVSQGTRACTARISRATAATAEGREREQVQGATEAFSGTALCRRNVVARKILRKTRRGNKTETATPHRFLPHAVFCASMYVNTSPLLIYIYIYIYHADLALKSKR